MCYLEMCCLSFKYLGVIFLLLISRLIPLWADNVACVFLVSYNMFCSLAQKVVPLAQCPMCACKESVLCSCLMETSGHSIHKNGPSGTDRPRTRAVCLGVSSSCCIVPMWGDSSSAICKFLDNRLSGGPAGEQTEAYGSQPTWLRSCCS